MNFGLLKVDLTPLTKHKESLSRLIRRSPSEPVASYEVHSTLIA